MSTGPHQDQDTANTCGPAGGIFARRRATLLASALPKCTFLAQALLARASLVYCLFLHSGCWRIACICIGKMLRLYLHSRVAYCIRIADVCFCAVQILALCSHCGCWHVRAPVLYSQMLVIMGSALQVPVVALQGVALHIDGSAEDHSFDTTLGQHS